MSEVEMDNHNQDDRRRSTAVILFLVAVPILYFVLIGPIARVYDSLPETVQTGIRQIYYPLEWLDEQMPGHPITKYIELWQ